MRGCLVTVGLLMLVAVVAGAATFATLVLCGCEGR
jgi:hypothetical protein